MAGVVSRDARSGAARGLGLATLLLALLQTPACASGLSRGGGEFRDGRGFAIGDPMAPGADPAPGWSRLRVDGASLAYRARDGTTMSWLVGCGRPLAKPKVLARHLMIGLRGRALTAEGPVAVDGGEGWFQRISAREAGKTVQMKTVTHVAGRCVHDWLLVGRGDLSGTEAAFDRWWSSFHADPALHPRPEPEEPLAAPEPAAQAPASPAAPVEEAAP